MTFRTKPWRPLEWIVAAVVALAIGATVADTVGEPPAARHAAGAIGQPA